MLKRELSKSTEVLQFIASDFESSLNTNTWKVNAFKKQQDMLCEYICPH